jgi:hypothetical protein
MFNRRQRGAGPDEPTRQLIGFIEQFGWGVRHVMNGIDDAIEELPFSYTVGLTAMTHPEIVQVGLPRESAHAFLNHVGEMVKNGHRFEAGSTTDELTETGYPIAFIEATDVSGLTAVTAIYGAVQALQLVWCDSSGRLPWDVGYSQEASPQTLLGSR